MTISVFIDGEAGTTGLQIRDRLAGRSDIEMLSIPDDRRKDVSARADLLNSADIAVLCLPDAAAKESVSLISNQTTRVIDASSAHRVNPDWTYGFAEMDATQAQNIANARFVANPGCWPQGFIATIRPLIKAGLLDAAASRLFMTGVSGYSGGGKQMIADYEAKGETAPAVMPYALTFEHKHLPEMAHYTGLAAAPTFVPTVGDFYKGMLETIPLAGLDAKQVHAILSEHYAAIPQSFVSVLPLEHTARTPKLDPEALNGTNQLQLSVFGKDGQTVVFAVYDNLGKGASGAAVQNLNLMIGANMQAGLAA